MKKKSRRKKLGNRLKSLNRPPLKIMLVVPISSAFLSPTTFTHDQILNTRMFTKIETLFLLVAFSMLAFDLFQFKYLRLHFRKTLIRREQCEYCLIETENYKFGFSIVGREFGWHSVSCISTYISSKCYKC